MANAARCHSRPPPRRWPAALPRAELQRIQGASHGLNATRPAAFNRSVLEFLARVDGVAPDVETS